MYASPSPESTNPAADPANQELQKACCETEESLTQSISDHDSSETNSNSLNLSTSYHDMSPEHETAQANEGRYTA